MEARSVLLLCAAIFGLASSSASPLHAQSRIGRPVGTARVAAKTTNFIVYAANQEIANQVAQSAEAFREQLAIHWLGETVPNWPQPCPIIVTAGDNLGAGGETSFTLRGGSIGGWQMSIQGSLERILDSVLPHEITHTVLATHFAPLGKPVPRWADEGACTTVEDQSERSKHDHFLVQFLSQGRGIPFATMFTLKSYPSDIMPLYAQGYSVSMFLIAQGGPRKFVQFLETGMKTEDWVGATEQHYGYPMIGKLQTAWNRWVGDGGGPVNNYTSVAMNMSSPSAATLAANVPSNSNVAVQPAAAFAPINANGSQVASAGYVPQGRFAVGNARGNSVDDGFRADPLRTSSSLSQPNSVAQTGSPMPANGLRTASASSDSSWYHRQLNEGVSQSPAAVGGIDFGNQPKQPNEGASSVAIDSQDTDDVSYTTAHPRPFESVGSAPARFDAGGSVPLIR